ncbi:hypothetical protein AB0D32_20030 [Micromonospora sp. NPDC048170]|uniref:hypothetical protein n=1 Tax=Micromonospora sp. NPDC048170 TaxID=3154819 RepID=UPI0033C84393
MPPPDIPRAGGAEPDGTDFLPDVAGELLRLAHERELAEIQRHIDELAGAHHARRMAWDRRPAIALAGPDAVAERLAQVYAATRAELRCLVRAGGWCPPADLPHRVVAEGSGGRASGSTMRWSPELPVSLYLADDRLGLVAYGDPEAAVLVYPGPLLDALGGLFEALWTRADPQRAGGPVDRWDGLPELLLAGLTDQAIGHQFGVSDRTVQRRIAKLMAELGATTRFQAGVRAALQGPVAPGRVGPAGRPGGVG